MNEIHKTILIDTINFYKGNFIEINSKVLSVSEITSKWSEFCDNYINELEFDRAKNNFNYIITSRYYDNEQHLPQKNVMIIIKFNEFEIQVEHNETYSFYTFEFRCFIRTKFDYKVTYDSRFDESKDEFIKSLDSMIKEF